jgi:hypothetical protein
MGIMKGDRIGEPDKGGHKRLSFAEKRPNNYTGGISIKYTGHQDHQPAANVVSTHSDNNQMFGVFLGDWPEGMPGGGENHLVAIQNAGDGWAQSHEVIKGYPELRYWLSCRSGTSSGSDWDHSVKITGECWENGVRLYLQCEDCGPDGKPKGNLNNKLVEVFLPLSYGSGYNDVMYEESYGYPIVTIVM